MKRVLQIAGIGIALMGVFHLTRSTESVAGLFHLEAKTPEARQAQSAATEIHLHAHDAHPTPNKSKTEASDHNPALDYELPEHKGVRFLEEVYNGKPLRVAQDLGVNKRGVMGFDVTKRDAISSLGACAHWIVSCVDPESRSLDQCVAAAPTCESDRPWETEEHTFCCPSTCADNYANARAQSVGQIEAFTQTFFTNPTCFPAAVELLENGPTTPTIPH